MKISHIVLIVLIAVGAAIIFSTLSDAGTYAVFNSAFKNPGDEYHVIGTWSKDKELVYEPAKDPNLTIFFMKDTAGVERRVVLHKEKPADFEKSERVVIIGKAEGEDFHARDILMKCPSKYNNATAGGETKQP